MQVRNPETGEEYADRMRTGLTREQIKSNWAHENQYAKAIMIIHQHGSNCVGRGGRILCFDTTDDIKSLLFSARKLCCVVKSKTDLGVEMSFVRYVANYRGKGPVKIFVDRVREFRALVRKYEEEMKNG